MRVVIGDRFRRWSSSSIAFRRWVTGILLVTHDSSVRPSPHSPRNRRQFLAREASAAVGGFVHPHISWRLEASEYLRAFTRGHPRTPPRHRTPPAPPPPALFGAPPSRLVPHTAHPLAIDPPRPPRTPPRHRTPPAPPPPALFGA